jgi:hypothetical protein
VPYVKGMFDGRLAVNPQLCIDNPEICSWSTEYTILHSVRGGTSQGTVNCPQGTKILKLCSPQIEG